MSPEIAPDLLRRLKRLRLGGLMPTLPDRAAHARQAKLGHLEFLELLLQDEIDRRDSQGLTQDHGDDLASPRTHRHPNSDLPRSRRDAIGGHSVKADAGE